MGAGRLYPAPEKSQVAKGFLKHSGTDPLKKQLDPREIFQRIRTIIAKIPYIFVIFQGGVRTLCTSPWICARVQFISIFQYEIMSIFLALPNTDVSVLI